jgi:hypothetical protein
MTDASRFMMNCSAMPDVVPLPGIQSGKPNVLIQILQAYPTAPARIIHHDLPANAGHDGQAVLISPWYTR